jgi:3-hydroxyacyl-[acyl-carrier-protein] dehydratase
MNPEKSAVLGYKDVRDDEFWVPGHIPGRPLLPGVIMIEAAAQLAAYVMRQRFPHVGFVGFTGCDAVKFRGQVPPGKRFYLLGKEYQFKPRRFICAAQGVVDDTLVFEAQITGMPI